MKKKITKKRVIWKEMKQENNSVKAYAVGFISNKELWVYTPKSENGRFAIFDTRREALIWKKKECAQPCSVREIKIFIRI